MGNAIEVEGKVVQVLPATMFRVQLANGNIVLAHLSGRMRKHFIKIMTGDLVSIEISPYDLTKARITYRHGGKPRPVPMGGSAPGGNRRRR